MHEPKKFFEKRLGHIFDKNKKWKIFPNFALDS
jgi:hypothetical protein